MRSRKPDGLANLRKGAMVGFYLLNKCDLPDFTRPFRVVDFGSIFTVPIVDLREHMLKHRI